MKKTCTTTETLARLSKDDSFYVRCAVVQNKNTSSETLTMLAGDNHFDVRCTVAENANTPKKIVEKFKREII